MKTMKPKKPIESLILTLRGLKVILDADLAELYGVPTKVFNQAVKTQRGPFPGRFYVPTHRARVEQLEVANRDFKFGNYSK
jgi:hypothetical protein